MTLIHICVFYLISISFYYYIYHIILDTDYDNGSDQASQIFAEAVRQNIIILSDEIPISKNKSDIEIMWVDASAESSDSLSTVFKTAPEKTSHQTEDGITTEIETNTPDMRIMWGNASEAVSNSLPEGFKTISERSLLQIEDGVTNEIEAFIESEKTNVSIFYCKYHVFNITY